MLNYETLLSSYDDKLTLMQWLKKVEAALKDASATGFHVNKRGNATITFSIDFENGETLESEPLVLQQGESVASAYIQNGNLHLILTNGDDLDAGNMFNGDITITGDLIGGVNTENGKKYRLVACVLRNVNGTWEQISGGHAPINVDHITQSGYFINVHYTFTAKNVVSFVACPDEEFSKLGYFIGASVNNNIASMQIYEQGNAGGYIAWNGSTWDMYGDITGVSMNSAGKITITHKDVGNSSFGHFASVRNGIYSACFDSVGGTEDEIFIKDNGTTITSPNVNFKIFWGVSGKPFVIDPAQANEQGNIWCLGVFEVE